MTLKNPSILFRAMILGAQGIFYNAFCERLDTLDGVPREKLTPHSSLVLFALSSDMSSVRWPSRRGSCHHIVSSGVHIGSICCCLLSLLAPGAYRRSKPAESQSG